MDGSVQQTLHSIGRESVISRSVLLYFGEMTVKTKDHMQYRVITAPGVALLFRVTFDSLTLKLSEID